MMLDIFYLFLFMTITAITLLLMMVGFSPVDSWHVHLVVIGCGLSIGVIIALWLQSEGIVKD